MRKIVFFDIDGTLVDSPTQIVPDSAVKAIGRLREAGHLAVLNTGRPYTHIDRRILEITWDGCVSGCGMQVHGEGRVLHRALPTPEQCRRMRDLVRQCGLDVFFEYEDGLVLDGTRPWGPQVAHEADSLGKRGLTIALDPDRPDFHFEKFITFDLGGGDMERFAREASRDFTLIDRGQRMTEAVLKGNSKSTGIGILLKYFGLSREDAYAFGDSTNDLPMFRCVGTPIAMGGSPEVLLREATFETSEVLNGGIQRGLERCGLIGK